MSKKACGCKWNLSWDWSQKVKKRKTRNRKTRNRKTRNRKTKGGSGGAAEYGSKIWGTNQTNDPSQGNVIKVENNPLTLKGGEGLLQTQGIQSQGIMAQASNPMEMYKELTKLQIPSVVESSTYKGGRKQKSKRKYT